MKRILVIPHHPGLFDKIKIRLVEIAKALSSNYEVYFVNWSATHGAKSFGARIDDTLKDVFHSEKMYKMDNLNVIEFPFLHRPLFLAPRFNSFWLSRAIDRHGIDVVINGSYYVFNIKKDRHFKYVFDLADFPFTGDRYFDCFIDRQIKKELSTADAATVVSRSLAKYMLDKYKEETLFVPNGAYINELRRKNMKGIENIRQRYNLGNKFIIGYVGFMGEWVDIKFLVSAFRQVKKDIKNACLLLVGASSYPRSYIQELSGDDVVFTGGIKEDINDYFNCLDIAVLPHRKSDFQDMAFHIKLIEYSAARKIVISTPLEEVVNLRFPSIILAELKLGDWVRAIKKARDMQWQSGWDRLVDPYDWKNIADKLCAIIK